MSLGDIRGQQDHFLKLPFGRGEIAVLLRRIARSKGSIGRSKPLLPAVGGCHTRGNARGDKQNACASVHAGSEQKGYGGLLRRFEMRLACLLNLRRLVLTRGIITAAASRNGALCHPSHRRRTPGHCVLQRNGS